MENPLIDNINFEGVKAKKNLENVFSIDFEGTVNITHSTKIQDQISTVGLNKNIISS